MTNATIFGGEGDNQPTATAAATTDAALFTALVGENQTYNTPEFTRQTSYERQGIHRNENQCP